MNFKNLIYVLIAVIFTSCQKEIKHNTLTNEEQKEGWKLLFNGKDINNWHLYNQGNKPSKWVVKNGEVICDPTIKNSVFGDLITNDSYTNFELKFEWKVAKGGNSGVFINVQEEEKYKATFVTGLEMQLLDNKNAEPRHQQDSTHWAGCLYAVECIGSNSNPKEFDRWNTSKIVQNKGHVAFYLNGKLTFENETNTQNWKSLIAATNMKNYPDFGLFSSGKIALQNHTDAVSFRNIKIKPL